MHAFRIGSHDVGQIRQTSSLLRDLQVPIACAATSLRACSAYIPYRTKRDYEAVRHTHVQEEISISFMDPSGRTAAAVVPDTLPAAPVDCCNSSRRSSTETRTEQSDRLLWGLRKYLLLLASLAAMATYFAGLNPPGGNWPEANKDGGHHLAGDHVLAATHHARYSAFAYSNATAFAASCVVIVSVLIVVRGSHDRARLAMLRAAMAVDALALAVAYAAGASRGGARTFTTLFAALVVVLPVFVYVAAHALLDSFLSRFVTKKLPRFTSCADINGSRVVATELQCDGGGDAPPCDDDGLGLKRRRKVLLLLAVFVATVTYMAGLSPPGAFWPADTHDGHLAGDPVLQDLHPRRFTAFFVCNTVALAASLLVVALILSNKFERRTGAGECSCRKVHPKEVVLFCGALVALLGLVGAYAAGSSREGRRATYAICLIGIVFLCSLVLDIVRVMLRRWLQPYVKNIQQ
ncbi:hypothetical protein ACP4OV_031561 [Aristida adscensionis]